jgi:hypothetical protein
LYLSGIGVTRTDLLLLIYFSRDCRAISEASFPFFERWLRVCRSAVLWRSQSNRVNVIQSDEVFPSFLLKLCEGAVTLLYRP